MSYTYEDKHLIDATDNQEVLPPDYQAAIDQPAQRIQDYEDWIDGLQQSNDKANGGEYEYYSANTNRA